MSLLAGVSQHQQDQMLEIQKEIARRSVEPLRLYVPNDYQKPFHDCMSSEQLVIGGNRSGKSCGVMVELAWAATGTHPIKGKYPKENMNIGVIGAGWRHIGMTIFPYLFKAGAFKIIKDLETKEWRAYHPVKDKDRKEECKPAPPLIPPRMIKSQSWVLKSANYIQTCELVNGTTIWFFSSDGPPPQGFQLDLVVFDEDINNESFVGEMQARLADRKGRFIWSAMPWSKNDALLGLVERADKAEEEGDTSLIKKFTYRFLDNPFIDDEEKSKMMARWSALGEEEVRKRAEGEFTIDSLLVYPNFHMGVHGYDNPDPMRPAVSNDWCRYAVIDPGHSVCAVLFAAVPPDDRMVLIYDELYIRGSNASIFAEQFAKKTVGRAFYAFLIDAHGGRITDIGSGKTPQQQYSEEMSKRGVRSEVTGSSFIPGSDNIQAGIQSVHMAMHIEGSGKSRLRVLRGACPNFEREIRRYKKKTMQVAGQTVVTDEPSKRGEQHLMDTLRYLCAFEPTYHKPKKAVEMPWWYEWSKKRAKDRAKTEGIVNLAPNSYSYTFDV
jgi:hypothetical protein